MDFLDFYRIKTFKNAINKMKKDGEVYLIHKKYDFICCYCPCGEYQTEEFYIKLKKEEEQVRIEYYYNRNSISDEFNELILPDDNNIIEYIVIYLKFYIEDANIRPFKDEEDNKKFKNNPLYCEQFYDKKDE